MTYRDDREAAHSRVEALERELAATKDKLAEAERVATLERELATTKVELAQAKADEAVRRSPQRRATVRRRRSSTPAGGVGERGRRRRAETALMVVFLLLGPTCGGWGIYSAVDTGSDLATGVRTQAVGTYKGIRAPKVPVIEVDGKRYRCSGSSGRVTIGVPVRYLRGNPARCRLEADIGQMNSHQWFRVGLSAAIFLFFTGYGIRLLRL